MKSILYHLTFCLLILSLSKSVVAQSVIGKITKLEKAVFTISSYDINEREITSRTGFFISRDGIAIAPSNIFLNSDSISVTLRNGKVYLISKIISSHKIANITMFKVFDHRQKGFDYIIPSQNAENGNNEVLIFSHPKEAESGVSLGVVTNVFQAPYLDRLIKVNSDFGIKSTGAPVMNNDGELIGIASFLKKSNTRQYISTHVINDTLWINHASTRSWKKTLVGKKQSIFHPYMLEGISNFMNSHWIESAKNFTLQIKNDTTDVLPYLLRGEARKRYENFMGMRADYNYVRKKNPKHFLLNYFEAIEFLKNKEENKAFVSLITSIEEHGSFAPSLVEFGLLVVKIRKDIETAKKCFDEAVKSSPLYAKGYYERSRLYIQYLENNEIAITDITKSISLNNRLPGSYSIRGTLRIQAENYLEAITDLGKAIDLDPNDTHALFNRGLAFYNLGMKQKCCVDWDTAGQMGHYKSIKYMSRYCNKTPIRRAGRR